MALTVGELTALVTVDDQTRAGLNETEGSVRQAGRRIADDAERAGNDAGRALGDGLADGADQGAADAGDAVAGRMDGMKTKMAAAGAMLGAAAGAALVAGMAEALDQSRIAGRLGAQLGATPAEAKKYGDLAGSMYADAITEDFQGAADAISATMRSGLLPPDATNAQIKSISTRVSDLASTFELDLGQTANAVGQIMKTKLAPNATAALDAITRGMQKMGPRADDIADTFNEYSVIFQRLGLDVKSATGMMSQGLKAGARDTDVVADALKEFALEGVQGSERIRKGFDMIGLSGDKMVKMISKGGPEATKALQMTLDKLRAMEDPVKRDAAAVELFGTKSEDMQKALLSLDPSTATKALGDVGGAADKMGDTLRDNAGTKVEAFKRHLTQGVVDFLGGEVIPALEDFRSFLVDDLGGMWEEAGKGADNLPDQIVSALGILGEKAFEKMKELGPKLIEGIFQAGQDLADYVMENPEEVFKAAVLAAAFVAALAALPILAGAALIAAAGAAIWSFVSGLITGLGENLPKWWDSFTQWVGQKADAAGTVLSALGEAISEWFSGLWEEYISGPVSRAWNDWVASARALPGRTGAALSALGTIIGRVASEAGQRFRTWLSRKFDEAVTYARSIPGKIGAGFSGMGSLLYSKGADIARGLLRGIRSMGSTIASSLRSWAAEIIPGPIAKALGIASPSRVMAEQVGKWIPLGIVEGIKAEAGAVDAAMRDLGTPPPPPGGAMAAGPYGFRPPGGSPYGTASAGPMVQIEHWHAAENGSPDDNARALAWTAKARG